MHVLAMPGTPVIYYQLGLFSALMVMAFFEARFYMDEHNLKNKKEYFKVAFIANGIVGLFLFTPVYWFDFLALGLYIIRSFVVGNFFIKLNYKKSKEQAKSSYLWTLPKMIFVFVGYNFAFFIVGLLIGVIYGTIINL